MPEDYKESTHCCEHCSHEEEEEENEKLEKILLIAGAVLFGLSFIPFFSDFVSDVLRIICAAVCGLPTAKAAFGALRKGKINEAFLMTVAVIAAILIKEFFEAAAVALLYRVGEALEDYAGERSKRSLESVFSIVPDKGHIILEDGGYNEIAADDIRPGMKLAVMPHEKVPVDGVVFHGEGTVDTSALTGESMPVEVMPGSKLLSGSINGSTALFYEATENKENSGAARIVSLVKEAAEKKGRSQRFTDRFSKYYTPAVIALSLLFGIIYLIISKDFGESVHRALVLVVASCPCAVVLSVPLAFLSSMGSLAKNGIIVKGSSYIETLAQADTAVFDKTGTLTSDIPSVGKIHPADGYTADEVLHLAAICDYFSSHPIALAIKNVAGDVDASDASDYEEIPGGGASVTLPLGRVCIGGVRLMERLGADVSAVPGCNVYVTVDGKTAGGIEIINTVKDDALSTAAALRKAGLKLHMLTGDSEKTAAEVSSKLGLDSYRANLLPQDKLDALTDIRNGGAKSIIYTGDGINDAPVLALADTGVAMGLGTQAACESADVILTDSALSKLLTCIRQSKNTMLILKENIVFALAVKLAVIVLGIIGIAPLWLAVIADVGTMIICVLNSARLLRKKSFHKAQRNG